MKIFVTFLLIIAIVICEEQKTKVKKEWYDIKWNLCKSKDHQRRSLGVTISKVDPFDVEIISIQSNSEKIIVGGKLIFKIISKIHKGEMKDPTLKVQLFNHGYPFMTFDYNLCSKVDCPIKEDTEQTFVIKQDVPSIFNTIKDIKKLKFIAHIEDVGQVVDCIEFEMEKQD